MLKIDWYFEQPHDFEHKNYLLLDYLQKIDSSYKILKLSPYLLWTEKLVNELILFQARKKEIENLLLKNKIELNPFSHIKITQKPIIEIEEIKTIEEIVEYSTPILQSKIKLGYKLLDKYPQILF